MNTKSLLLAGAMMIASVIPAFAADPAPAAAEPVKTVAAPVKTTKACNLKKKSHVASKKQTNKTAIVKKTK
jgi:hypothetical protein